MRAHAPVRPRSWLAAALVVLAILLVVRVSGWTPVAREPLPVTVYAPSRAEEPGAAQTLANGTFTAGGGEYAWEVFGFPEMRGTGVHSFRYHVHRTGGEPARVWPEAALMLDARGDNLGEGSLDALAHLEQGVLVVRQGFAPPGPGVYDMTAILRLEVVRDVAVGYVVEGPLEVRLPFRTESVPLPAEGGPRTGTGAKAGAGAGTRSERDVFMSEDGA